MAARSSTSFKIDYLAWQSQYRAALLEVNPDDLPRRIQEALAALYGRLQLLSRSSVHGSERQAIEDALGAIQVLVREIVDPTGRKKGDQAAA